MEETKNIANFLLKVQIVICPTHWILVTQPVNKVEKFYEEQGESRSVRLVRSSFTIDDLYEKSISHTAGSIRAARNNPSVSSSFDVKKRIIVTP